MSSIALQPESSHPFNRSGLAALSDLETLEWRDLFQRLEREQTEFLAKEDAFRSPEYKWPRDPLHTWSRVWEYPYAYHHLCAWRARFGAERLPRVMDLGSGVTFFPFSVARLGCHVTCTDIDPICARDLGLAAKVVSHAPGKLDFILSSGGKLPFEDAEIDAVYCISVLEHLPNPETVVLEIARILKAGGLLVLTIDLDLRGDKEIGVEPFRKLTSALKAHFGFLQPETTIHPRDMLHSAAGLCGLHRVSSLPKMWFLAKQAIKPLFGKNPRPLLPFSLTVNGYVLKKVR